jgi:hypothetical protein
VDISLEAIHSITREFSFRFPNFYFYDKERIITGGLLKTGNYLLRLFHSRQPVWRLLIFLKRIEKVMGIDLVKRCLYSLKMRLNPGTKLKSHGFSLIKHKKTVLNS